MIIEKNFELMKSQLISLLTKTLLNSLKIKINGLERMSVGRTGVRFCFIPKTGEIVSFGNIRNLSAEIKTKYENGIYKKGILRVAFRFNDKKPEWSIIEVITADDVSRDSQIVLLDSVSLFNKKIGF
jgi:hypothetical protein